MSVCIDAVQDFKRVRLFEILVVCCIHASLVFSVCVCTSIIIHSRTLVAVIMCF